MLVQKSLEHLETAQRDMAELSIEIRKLLEPYLKEGGAEALADTVNMTVEQLHDVTIHGVYGLPFAQLMQLAWALDHNLRFDLVPHNKEH